MTTSFDRWHPMRWPLALRLLVLTERLLLCDTRELARLAGAHPGSTRRALGRLRQEGLLLVEHHSLPTPARRYRPSREGLRWVAGLNGDTLAESGLAAEHTDRVLRHLRNRLEPVSAARAVFIALLEACRTPSVRGRVALWAWNVPAPPEHGPLDGTGWLNAPGGERLVGVLLDRPKLAPHHLLPKLRGAARALAEESQAMLLLVGPDVGRARLLRESLRDEAGSGLLPRLPIVHLEAPERAAALVTALAPEEASAPFERWTEDLGGGAGMEGFARRRPGRAEAVVEAHRASLTPAGIAVLEALADRGLQRASTLRLTVGSSYAGMWRLLHRLRADGLVAAMPGRPVRYALTHAAVELLAIRDGFPTLAYARARGIVFAERDGSGLEGRLKYLAHDAGADAFFRLFDLHARGLRARGRDAALVGHEPPAVCHRAFRHQGGWCSIRPDGFGLLRLNGVDHPFHLEWDRGTEKAGQHARKLAAYRAYVEAEAYRADRGQPPTLLYVFARWQDEQRVLGLARQVLADLPEPCLLATTRWRLKRDGPTAAIWRGPFQECRQAWPFGGQPVAFTEGGNVPAGAAAPPALPAA